jgi:glycosyltransferase involved in cell wall biosynthesis
MNDRKVSIIIPAYDEEETIGGVIEGIQALYPEFEIIVINDGSSDNTAQAAKDAGALVYSHPYNIGNGASIKSGIRFA